jgi:hypothetical protein
MKTSKHTRVSIVVLLRAGMKKMIVCSVVVFLVTLLTPQIVVSQGTTYLSNLGQNSTNSNVVGSDSWLAESFLTGNNVGGYLLNSVQLAMTNASGNPNGFALLLYSSMRPNEYFPSNNLGALNGSANPATADIFTYTTVSNMTLLPGTVYFLVVTAGTTVANGAYEWSLASLNYNPSGGWRAPAGVAGQDTYSSINGLNWTRTFIDPQFAINASAIPEPGVLSLLALGSLGLFLNRRKG